MTKLAHALGPATGPSIEDCHVLAYRYDPAHGFKPDDAESWVLQSVGGALVPQRVVTTWFTGLWRSPAGRTWVTEVDGRVHVSRDLRPDTDWDVHALPSVLAGVWGIDDAQVWVWGGLGDETHLFLWDGSSWRKVESPGRVMGMHGISRDLVYAVGDAGLIAAWDGSRWARIPSPVRAPLSSVFVVSADEMYACGNSRRLLEGTVHGWSEVLAADAQLLAVARYGDAVWVAGPELGLTRLGGRALVSCDEKLKPSRLDARGRLLISCADAVVDTDDGVNFRRLPRADFEAIVRGQPPRWRP